VTEVIVLSRQEKTGVVYMLITRHCCVKVD